MKIAKICVCNFVLVETAEDYLKEKDSQLGELLAVAISAKKVFKS